MGTLRRRTVDAAGSTQHRWDWRSHMNPHPTLLPGPWNGLIMEVGGRTPGKRASLDSTLSLPPLLGTPWGHPTNLRPNKGKTQPCRCGGHTSCLGPLFMAPALPPTYIHTRMRTHTGASQALSVSHISCVRAQAALPSSSLSYHCGL